MIAIIIASQRYPEMHGLDEHLPLSLFPLVDRPLLQHIVEYLVGLGICRFEFILSHLPEKVEACLGDGARWGCTFRYHLIPVGTSPYRMVRTIATDLGDTILLGCADCLPEMESVTDAPPVLFYTGGNAWSGWAVLPPDACVRIESANPQTEEEMTELLARDSTKLVAARTLSFRSGPELLRSQRQLMSGEFSGLLIGGRQSEKSIWISRNVSIHPTAILEAPVYIGPNCRIGRGAKLGPCAVISENCILDSFSSVENSVVAPGSYIGQGLELDQVLINRNLLVNVKIGTSFLASETFLLSSLTDHPSHHPIEQLVSRLAAFFLLVLFLPAAALFYLFMALFRQGRFSFEEAVCIPADDHPGSWRKYSIPRFQAAGSSHHGRWADFFFHFWPGLFAVLNGNLFLVGVQPRSQLAISDLPNDWKSIYLKCRAGLITEASVMFGDHATADEVFAAEAYYAATKTLLHDVRLACVYFRNLILIPDAPEKELAGSTRP